MDTAQPGHKLMEMAARIREMREIIGYTPAQMAEKTGVSVEDYEAVEAGRLDPTFNFLHPCAIAFGIDINALLEGHSAHLSGYEVTRAGQGPLTAHESHMDIRNQAAMFQNRLGTPYWVTYMLWCTLEPHLLRASHNPNRVLPLMSSFGNQSSHRSQGLSLPCRNPYMI